MSVTSGQCRTATASATLTESALTTETWYSYNTSYMYMSPRGFAHTLLAFITAGCLTRLMYMWQLICIYINYPIPPFYQLNGVNAEWKTEPVH